MFHLCQYRLKNPVHPSSPRTKPKPSPSCAATSNNSSKNKKWNTSTPNCPTPAPLPASSNRQSITSPSYRRVYRLCRCIRWWGKIRLGRRITIYLKARPTPASTTTATSPLSDKSLSPTSTPATASRAAPSTTLPIRCRLLFQCEIWWLIRALIETVSTNLKRLCSKPKTTESRKKRSKNSRKT